MQLIIQTGGVVRCLYAETIDLATLGPMAIERASHVEPTPDGQWLADLSPVKGRTVEIKVRFADFKTISRALTLHEPTNVTQELLAAGLQLLDHRLPPVGRHL